MDQSLCKKEERQKKIKKPVDSWRLLFQFLFKNI